MESSAMDTTLIEDRHKDLQGSMETVGADWSELDVDASTTEDEGIAKDDHNGQHCGVKTLFEGETTCTCCINWVDEMPKDLRPSAEEESENRRHALLIRLRRNHNDGKPMVLHSIVIQSSYLKSILGQVFQEYSGITITLKKLVFRAPFDCFFHEWHRLEKIVREVEDPIGRSHGRLLQKVLRSELRETISLSNDLNRNGVITYDYLWTIFKPGVDVYTFEDGYDRIYRLQRATYVSNISGEFLQLTVHEISCDGDRFGYQPKLIHIYKFSGTKEVQDLDVFPASCHPRLEEVKNSLRQRGEMFKNVHLKSYFYGAYKGTVMDGHNNRNVDGRIVVDPLSHADFTTSHVNLMPFDSSSLKPEIDVSDQPHHPVQAPPGPRPRGRRVPQPPPYPGRPPAPPPQMMPPNPPPPPPGMAVGSHPKRGSKYSRKPEDIPDNLLHLCSAYVRGYCFKIKKWVIFHIDHVREIQWHDDAFDSLVLQDKYKKIIKAFVESHVEHKDQFDDFIEGKGQGITMLLEGPPGVGKTLTAEAVSERLRRPLYAMGAGELGATPEAVEENLEMILEAAAKWDAVLLLDECDVLLAQRTSNDLGRNSIVAIFLRLLEYYRGMLFLTTNRAEAIDPAFQSRVHLTIHYPRLDAAARRQVWARFDATAHRPTALRAPDFDALQDVVVNGREIKNVFKTAQLLASHEKKLLAIEHIHTALSVSRVGAFDP